MGDVLEIEPVGGGDAGLRAALVEGELPTADLDVEGRRFFRVVADGEAIGYGGLEAFGPEALLRSVVVPGPLRGHGHGRRVAEAVMAEAKRLGVRRAWLFTTSAVDFFSHLGFAVVERARAPETILTTRQATTSCATAAMMVRGL
jgi:N-acetylglutamate synthase-like GNAT family acetyltransferase